MERPFNVWHGDNMPVQAPFYKSPSIPYGCKNMKSLDVFCRARKGVLKEYLAHTPFEYISDNFLISFGDYANGTSAVYHDIGIVVPVRYKNLYGGYYLFEYEDLASSVAAGRELWGYPKKVADFDVKEYEGRFNVNVSREAHTIINICAEDIADTLQIPENLYHPHLLLYTMPRYGGPGIQFQKILKRDTSPDYVAIEKKFMRADVDISTYINPPVLESWGDLKPEEVYGAVYGIGDFSATHEHGWAELVDVTIPDQDYAPK